MSEDTREQLRFLFRVWLILVAVSIGFLIHSAWSNWFNSLEHYPTVLVRPTEGWSWSQAENDKLVKALELPFFTRRQLEDPYKPTTHILACMQVVFGFTHSLVVSKYGVLPLYADACTQENAQLVVHVRVSDTNAETEKELVRAVTLGVMAWRAHTVGALSLDIAKIHPAFVAVFAHADTVSESMGPWVPTAYSPYSYGAPVWVLVVVAVIVLLIVAVLKVDARYNSGRISSRVAPLVPHPFWIVRTVPVTGGTRSTVLTAQSAPTNGATPSP